MGRWPPLFALVCACTPSEPPPTQAAPISPAPPTAAPSVPAASTSAPVVDLAPPAPAPPPADGRYQVELAGPMSAGQRFRYHEQTSRTVTMQERAERIAVDLSGVETIVAVDERGEVTIADTVVERCVAETPRGTEVLLQPGTVLRVESRLAPARGRILANGVEPTGRAAELLGLVLDTSHDGADEDDFLGTRTPRRAGESWPVDRPKVAAYFARSLPGVEAADVEGTTTFVGPVRHAGWDALESRARIHAHVRTMPPPASLPDAEIRGVELAFELHCIRPRPDAGYAFVSHFTMEMTTNIRLPGPSDVTTREVVATEVTRIPVR